MDDLKRKIEIIALLLREIKSAAGDYSIIISAEFSISRGACIHVCDEDIFKDMFPDAEIKSHDEYFQRLSVTLDGAEVFALEEK